MPRKTRKYLRKSGKYVHKRKNRSNKKVGGMRGLSRSSKVVPRNAYLATQQKEKKRLNEFYKAAKAQNEKNSEKYPGRRILDTHFDVE